MATKRFDDVTSRLASRLSRRRLLRGAGGGLAGAALAGAGPRMAGIQKATPATMVANDGDVAGLVDIGGRSLHLECRGSGGPTVVLESGFRDSGASWSTDLLTDTGATPATPRTMVLPGVADAMTRALDDHPLPRIPLYVISAGLPFDISEADLGFSSGAWQDAWSTAQDQLAMLLPDARHVIAGESGHIVHLQQPDLVIEAIRQVVNAVRDPESWAASISSGWTP